MFPTLKPRPLEVPRTRGPNWHAFYVLAAMHDGYFRLEHAEQAGISQPLVQHHLRTRWFERVARGIFRVTAFPPPLAGDLMVAWLWSEQRGVFSHETALDSHDLLGRPARRIHMTLPPEDRGRRWKVPKHLSLHFAELNQREMEWIDLVPVTRVRRTFVDCIEAGVPPKLLADAYRLAVQDDLISDGDIAAIRDVAPGLPAPLRKRRPRIAAN